MLSAEDLAPRGTPLEYWFLKLHAGDLAFLVDFIVRRRTVAAEVRVSLWVRGRGRVARIDDLGWQADPGAVAIGASRFEAGRSVGAVDDIAWDLTYEAGAGRAAPAVPLLSRLHPFDLELVSRPGARFQGYVVVAGERFDIVDTPGSLTHYWGRRLADRWHWISADSFGDTDLTIEAVALRTRLWGVRPTVAIGYLWMAEAGREDLLISPLNGIITLAGTANDYTLVARRLGRTTRLRCAAPADRYNDLGEGIHQTLHGTCTVLGRDLADTRAGLEFRVMA
jgi:hypothetical protein